MKINKLILFTIFSSILLYSEPIKKANPFDTLIIDTPTKGDENSNIDLQELQLNLQNELTNKNHILTDIHHKRFLSRFYRQNSYTQHQKYRIVKL